ncbi:hypothetical protein L1D59_18455 [Pseudoalteromonas piscicida]|nr:hypothetical protein [Pseudoalteromonas piscicida]
MVGRYRIVGRALARQTFTTTLPFAWHALPTLGRALARQTFTTTLPFIWHAPPTVGRALARQNLHHNARFYTADTTNRRSCFSATHL